MQFIAEVKTKSPFGFQSTKSWDYLFELANEIGDIISIHTDPLWDGSFDLIKKARKLTEKPILAKGIHTSNQDIIKAIDCGADFVLCVGRNPQFLPDKVIIEPNSLAELELLKDYPRIVWNQRELNHKHEKFSNDKLAKIEEFGNARNIYKGWLCQASLITHRFDINDRADAVLVGTYLENFKK